MRDAVGLPPDPQPTLSRVGPGRPMGPIRGAITYAFGASLFSGNDAIVKVIGTAMPTVEVMFLRNLFGFWLLLGLMALRGRIRMIRTRQPVTQVVRGLAVLGLTGSLFVALRNIPLVDATVLFFSAPLVAPLLAWLVLGERVGWSRFLAAVVGFAGVLVVLQPGAGIVNVWALAAVAGGLFNAVTAVCSRKLARTDSGDTTILLSTVVATAGSGVALALADPVVPRLDHTFYLVVAGAIGSGAQVVLMAGIRVIPVAVAMPLSYMYALTSTLVGWLAFGEVPSGATAYGAVLIIGAGVAVATMEARQVRRQREAAVA